MNQSSQQGLLSKMKKTNMKKFYKKIIDKAGIPNKFINSNFKNYDKNFFDGLERKVDYIIDHAKSYPELNHEFLYLAGNSGNGKTHLAVAAAKVMCKKKAKKLAKEGKTTIEPSELHLLYINWRSKIKKIRNARFGSGNTNFSVLEAIEKMERADILIIDDLFARSKISLSDIDDVFDLLNYRYESEKPTIITSNKMPGSFLTSLEPEDLLDYRYKKISEEDLELITERLSTRILESAGDTILEFDGPNYRKC